MHVLGLDETWSVAYNLGETQTCNKRNKLNFFLLFCREILESMWQEEENFEVLKRCCIQIYPTSFLLYLGKAVNLLHIWNLEWNNVKVS